MYVMYKTILMRIIAIATVVHSYNKKARYYSDSNLFKFLYSITKHTIMLTYMIDLWMFMEGLFYYENKV